MSKSTSWEHKKDDKLEGGGMPQGRRSDPPHTNGTETEVSTRQLAAQVLHQIPTDEPHYSVSEMSLAVSLYCTVSIGIVFLNRYLFSSAFPYPVFVSWFQQIVGLTSYVIIASVGSKTRAPAVFTPVCFNWRLAVGILPQTVAFVGMIGFSNTCLKYVQISTYQVARALTLLFSLILSTIILKANISRKSWAACGVVMSGFLVGSLDPSTLSLLGVTLGVCSSMFQAFYNVRIKQSLDLVHNDETVLVFYNLLIAAFLFIPVIPIAGEMGFLMALPLHPSTSHFWITWGQLSLSGLLGIALTLASYYCVRVTSPVTFNVAGYAKACLQSLGGIVLLGELVTTKSATGIMLTLGGSAWYSFVKLAERGAAPPATSVDVESGRADTDKGKFHHHSIVAYRRLSQGDDEKVR